MPSVSKTRVIETSTSTGAGAFTTTGAITGYRPLSSVCAVGDTVEYGIEAVNGSGVPTGEWETGLGTYSAANTLTRNKVDASSNANAFVVFSVGTKNVYITALLPQETTVLQPSGDTSGAQDTAAILAIQAKYPTRRFVYGAGDFYINATIPMRPFDTHVGQGRNVTFLRPVGTIANGMFSYNSATTVQNCNIAEMTLYGYSNDSIAINSKVGVGSIQDVNIGTVYFDGFSSGTAGTANPVLKIGDPWGLRMLNTIVEQTGARPAIAITSNGTSVDGAMLSNCKIKNNAGSNLVITGCNALMITGCEFYTTGTGKDNIVISGGTGNMITACQFLGAGSGNFGVRCTGNSVGNIISGCTIYGQAAATFTGISFESGSTVGQVRHCLIYGCATYINDAAGATVLDYASDGALSGGMLRPPISTPAQRSTAFATTPVALLTSDSASGKINTRGVDDFELVVSAAKKALAADVTNSTVALADVTALSFAVAAGVTYRFRFVIFYTAAALTTGSLWSINGPALTRLLYRSTYGLAATGVGTVNEGLAGYNQPTVANASSPTTTGNVAIIEGYITPSAVGTVIARFASEVAASAIVAKIGSFVEYERVA